MRTHLRNYYGNNSKNLTATTIPKQTNKLPAKELGSIERASLMIKGRFCKKTTI